MDTIAHIQSLTGQHPIRFLQSEGAKSDVILLDGNPASDFNLALHDLNPGGSIFIYQSLPLVHHLVKLGFPVIIHRDHPELACFMPVEDEPLDSYRINARDIPKTLDKYLWQWLQWRSDYANSLIIIESRFWDHLIWNRHHPNEQRFLP